MKILIDKELVQKVIWVLEESRPHVFKYLRNDAISDLRQALEQSTEQEATRQPLTDEEIAEYFRTDVDTGSLLSFADGVRYAETSHRITGEKE